MVRQFIVPILLSSTIGCLAIIAAAQTPKVKDAIQRIPSTGQTAKDFIPAGWEIYSEAHGDLNGDSLDDAALTLSPHASEEESTSNNKDLETPPYIVVVLLAQPDKSFKLFAVNGNLYPTDSGNGPLELKIAKGVLVTNQNYRDGWAVDVTFRFRFDAAQQKLMLIGFDLENYSRTSIYEGRKSSENYLTGLRVDYAKTGSPHSKTFVYKQVSQTQIEQSRVSFEEARFNEDDGDLFNIRPFSNSHHASVSLAKQTSIDGNWQWRGPKNSKKEQVLFGVDIKQAGAKLSGQLWFGMLVDGENDGSDSSSIPFVGTITNDTATIEFDPKDFHTIDEENVRYKKAKSPSVATLQLQGGKLVWTQASGVLDDLKLGIPNSFSLSRVQ